MSPTKRLHSSPLHAGSTAHQIPSSPELELGPTHPAKRFAEASSPGSPPWTNQATNGKVAAVAGTMLDGISDVRSEKWQNTMQDVVRAVISVHFCCPTPFDTEGSYVSEATGFVVDAERGIIMTNRHVVGPGPFTGFAIFDNHEEVPVWAVYRDPVHDFGFLRFDPKAVRHMKLHHLELLPELAQVGTEIRVVGNDAGEKLSILAGFISRMDRNAPEYGDLTYNDFNTEYIQAAASASGGSSGSPVVDVNGKVLALQAGGSTTASTDFFLPLYRGKRALKCLQNNQPITRGTIQVQWMLKPYDECIRLGLTEEEEVLARENHPGCTGMLVAETILDGGPAENSIEEGDILIEVNGKPTALFRDVDDVLDSSVGENIEYTVLRDGQRIKNTFVVQNLHDITPSRFAMVAGAVIHDLSYQLARLYAVPVRGVFVAETGQVFRPDRDRTGWLLEEIDNHPVSCLDEFLKVAQKIPDRKRVSARFRHLTDLHTIKSSIVCMDRHWHKDITVATRNDETGVWDMKTIGEALPADPITRLPAQFAKISDDERTERISRSFVKVETRIPLSIEGYTASECTEYGLVIDAEKGYVMVSRFCLPHFMCDVSVIVAESVILPARVVFLHPQQNYAIVQFDRSQVDAPLESAVFSDEPLKQGTRLHFVGHNFNMRVFTTETKVTDISVLYIPIGTDLAPRYRATNIESIGFDAPMISDCISGVLTDENGTVRAWWSSFMGDVSSNGRDRQFRLALDTSSISGVVAKLEETGTINPRFLDLECNALHLVGARIRGVPDKWLKKVQEKQPERPQLLQALRVASSLAGKVFEGDILLSIDGELLTSAVQLLNLDKPSVSLTLIRSGKEKHISVKTTEAESVVTRTIVSWCGLIVHAPHHAVVQQIKQPPSLVYVDHVASGSPGNQYGVSATHFITHVGGKPVQTVEEFYDVVSAVPDDTYVKLRIVTFDGIPCACSIRTNYHYFKTWRRDLVDGSWQREGGDPIE